VIVTIVGTNARILIVGP